MLVHYDFNTSRYLPTMLQVPVQRPAFLETTSLGAAYAAGLAVGFWSEEWIFGDKKEQDRTKSWQPAISKEQTDIRYKKWQKAVALSFNLAELDS